MPKKSKPKDKPEDRRRRAVKRIATELERKRQLPNSRRVARILAERFPDLAASHVTVNADMHALGIAWKV